MNEYLIGANQPKFQPKSDSTKVMQDNVSGVHCMAQCMTPSCRQKVVPFEILNQPAVLGLRMIIHRLSFQRFMDCYFLCISVRSLEELARLSQQTHDVASTAAKTIQQGQTVVAVRPTQTSSMSRMPQFAFNLQSNVHYCQYCSQHCRSKKNWEEHCASEHHMFNVNSDKEHQWNYRQPSWGVHGGNYQLCPR